MITIRKAEERGHFDHGWLNTYHTFSFDAYSDPEHMGYRSLRVINQDRVHPARGFPTHGHRDMEIITYVLEGALEHRDSMGNGSIIRPGDVQRMSAGTGVTHSEHNSSKKDMVHLLQIWILPERRGLTPGYEQVSFSKEELRGRIKLIASQDGRDGSVTIHQDASIFASVLESGEEIIYPVPSGRGSWLQVARGKISLNGLTLKEGDGAAVSEEQELLITGAPGGEFLLFDLA
jgi:quercetin 2,3-dioxygenase